MYLLLFSQYLFFHARYFFEVFFSYFWLLRFYCMIGSHLKFALLVASFHQNPMEMNALDGI